MPRHYDLGRRAEQQAETRGRILTAALDLYCDRGYAATTTGVVAAAADVAPGTVRNHFPTLHDLAQAAGEQVLSDLAPPDPSILHGLATVGERVERLTQELVAFFERAEPWWSLLQRDPQLARAWAGLEERYERDLDRLLRAALGPLADDRVVMVVTATTVGPPLHYALRGAGLAATEAVRAQLGVIVPWLEAMGTERAGSSPAGRVRPATP
jgi:AcrR family transcriptional regulator